MCLDLNAFLNVTYQKLGMLISTRFFGIMLDEFLEYNITSIYVLKIPAVFNLTGYIYKTLNWLRYF
jgi:hypothetical protein